MKQQLKIGELASLTGCPVVTIRYYEKEGFLPAPSRTDSNYRVYNHTHLSRLRFIMRCRALDMTQIEIRELLAIKDAPEAHCGPANQLLDEHLAHVEERIQQLKALQQELEEIRRACTSPAEAEHCGILEALSQPDSGKEQPTKHHIRGAHALHRTTD